MSFARHHLVFPLLILMILGLAACDEEDGGWDQPTDPGPTIPPSGEPTLVLSVLGQEQVVAGSQSSVTLGLENTGEGPADSVVVELTLPAPLTLDQAQTDRGDFDQATSRWTLLDVGVDSTASLSLLFTVPAGESGQQVDVSASVVHVAPTGGPVSGHQAQLSFTVVNQPPVARVDTYTVDEGAWFVAEAPGVLANDEDPNGETLTLQIEPLVAPLHGVMSFQADGAMAYAHDGSEVLADSLQYVIIDADAARDTGTVHITVTPVNDLPVLDAPVTLTIEEGQTFDPIALDDLVTDPDNTPEELEWQILGANELIVSLSSDRVVTVSPPDADWNGSDALIFRVRDPEDVPVNASVHFVVTSINDVPVVAPLPDQSIEQGGVFLPIPLDNYVADVDHDDSELEWTVTGEQPLLVFIGAGRLLTVSPPNGTWTGSVEMTLRATDPEGDWAERQVRFEVTSAK